MLPLRGFTRRCSAKCAVCSNEQKQGKAEGQAHVALRVSHYLVATVLQLFFLIYSSLFPFPNFLDLPPLSALVCVGQCSEAEPPQRNSPADPRLLMKWLQDCQNIAPGDGFYEVEVAKTDLRSLVTVIPMPWHETDSCPRWSRPTRGKAKVQKSSRHMQAVTVFRQGHGIIVKALSTALLDSPGSSAWRQTSESARTRLAGVHYYHMILQK